MTLAVNLAQGASNNVTFRNRIINGGMVIDQRNNGATISLGSSPLYAVDRFESRVAQGSGHTGQRVSTAPVGFNYSLKITIGTGGSPTAGQNTFINQQIEGFNFADLGWGTANAQTITVSFMVYSSLTGTFAYSISNNALSRSYVATYSIPVANTWTAISLTIPGDTSGTWVGATNGVGSYNFWDLGSGSDKNTTAGAWQATWGTKTSATVNVAGTSGATFYITGVQLEAGTTASPFEYRQYGTELALCQRYFLMWANGGGQNIGLGGYYNSTYVTTSIAFPVTMRSAPTLTQTSGTNYYGIYSNNTLDYFDSFSSGIQQPTVNCAGIDCSTNVSGTSGALGRMVANSGAYIGFSAEL